MDQHLGHACLLHEVGPFLLSPCMLCPVGKALEAVHCVGLNLGLHHLQSEFVLIAFTMHWTSSHQHLLVLLLVVPRLFLNSSLVVMSRTLFNLGPGVRLVTIDAVKLDLMVLLLMDKL